MESEMDKLSFEPKEDITAYELAMLLRLKMTQIYKESWEQLPPELARHFVCPPPQES
jgi:hypothetical protein